MSLVGPARLIAFEQLARLLIGPGLGDECGFAQLSGRDAVGHDGAPVARFGSVSSRSTHRPKSAPFRAGAASDRLLFTARSTTSVVDGIAPPLSRALRDARRHLDRFARRR